MTNEITTQNQTIETSLNTTVSETENYAIVKDENGKFKRKAKFSDYCSIQPQTREEKIQLMNLLNGDEESGNGLKDQVGKQIEVANVIFRKYDKINEDTGVIEYGVLTYLIAPDGIAYVTSSKTTYFTVKNILDTFGYPHEETWENVLVKVVKQKGRENDVINVKMIG
jgi:hypothetical protein